MKRTYLIKLAIVIAGLICVGVCGCKKEESQKEEASTGEITIDAIRESVKKISDSELDDLEKKFLSNPNYQYEFLQKDYTEYLPLFLALQKRKPQMSQYWCRRPKTTTAKLVKNQPSATDFSETSISAQFFRNKIFFCASIIGKVSYKVLQ